MEYTIKLDLNIEDDYILNNEDMKNFLIHQIDGIIAHVKDVIILDVND